MANANEKHHQSTSAKIAEKEDKNKEGDNGRRKQPRKPGNGDRYPRGVKEVCNISSMPSPAGPPDVILRNSKNNTVVPDGGMNSDNELVLNGSVKEINLSVAHLTQTCWLEVELQSEPPNAPGVGKYVSSTVSIPPGVDEMRITYPPIYISGLARSTTYVWSAICREIYVSCAKSDNGGDPYQSQGRVTYGGADFSNAVHYGRSYLGQCACIRHSYK